MARSGFSSKKRILLTSSWDDGSRFDLKLAELLARYAIKATFYIPTASKELKDTLLPEEIKRLGNIFEIGAHTYSHSVLTSLSLDKARQEIEKGKKSLEDLLGKRVSSFCFPRGKFNKSILKVVLDSGFDFARTTGYLRTNAMADINKGLLHTTIQVYNHPLRTYLLSSLKRMDGEGFINIMKNAGGMTGFGGFAASLLSGLKDTGGFFHIWGHSWEIERYNLWGELEEFMKFVKSTDNVAYCTNAELWEFLNGQPVRN